MMRRVRGVLRTALTWGVAWSIPGFVWVSWFTFFKHGGPRVGLLSFVWTILLNWSFVGAISGAIFAVAVSVAERRTGSLGALSMRRVAAWGAVGGAGLPLLLLPYYFAALPNPLGFAAGVTVLNGVLGAGSAAASLSLARRPGAELASTSRASVLEPPPAA